MPRYQIHIKGHHKPLELEASDLVEASNETRRKLRSTWGRLYRFNIEVAREARKMGIPGLYYVAPKLWVWGAGRIHTLKK